MILKGLFLQHCLQSSCIFGWCSVFGLGVDLLFIKGCFGYGGKEWVKW